MSAALGYLELALFFAFVVRTLYRSDCMIECVIYSYVCQIINYKLVGSVPWLTVVGVTLYPGDFVVALMLLILIVRGIQLNRRLFTIFFAIFMVMAIQSMVRGGMTFGISSAFLGDLRKYLYFIVCILYFWLMPMKKMDQTFWKGLNILFWCITVYMWIILIFYYAGYPLGERANQRPLLADYAIIYTIYIAVRWYQDLVLSQKPKLSFTTLLFTATLILNRFNTTWTALAVAVGILMIGRFWTRDHQKFEPRFYLQVVVMIAGAFFLMHNAGGVTESLVETSNKFDANQENTFSSRIELWKSLLTLVKGHYAWIGYPFGTGFHATYRGDKWQATPHNGYLETLLRTGYIGVMAMLASMILLLKRAIQKKNLLPIMICAACMTYWVSYSLTLEQGALIGICAQMVLVENKRQKDLLLTDASKINL